MVSSPGLLVRSETARLARPCLTTLSLALSLIVVFTTQQDVVSARRHRSAARHLLDFLPNSNWSESHSEHCGGDWFQQYARLHHAILAGSAPQRYFYSVGVEAGWADRVVGIISELYLAIFQRRAFKITTFALLPSFDLAYDSPFINWTQADPPDELIEPMRWGTLTPLEQQLYPAPIDPKEYAPLVATQPGNAWLLDGDNAAAKIYVRSNMSALHGLYEVFNDPKVWLMASNRGRTFRMVRDNRHHNATFAALGITPEAAFKCGFDFLFRPNAVIRALMEPIATTLRDTSALKIGIHVRVGDRVFSKDVGALEPYLTYFQCAERIEQRFGANGTRPVWWYFTSDSFRLRSLVKEKYGAKVLTFLDDHPSHSNQWNFKTYISPNFHNVPLSRLRSLNQSEFNVTEFNQRKRAAFQTAVAHTTLLSRTDFQVLTSNSGYGRASAWLAGWDRRRQYSMCPGCVHFLERCGGTGDDPEVSSLEWSGI